MPFSDSEEIVNAATHGLGFVLSVAGVGVLMVAAVDHGSAWDIFGCGLYSVSLMAVYAASTLSHAFRSPRPKRFFTILDPALIYLLIAGTYTPFALHYLREGWWWLLTAVIWAVAITGFFSKLVRPDNRGVIAVSLYVLLGWLPAVAMKQLFETVPVTAVWLIVAGGLCYTVGTIFINLDEKVPYFHAVWHTFVIAGSICHYLGILFFVAY